MNIYQCNVLLTHILERLNAIMQKMTCHTNETDHKIIIISTRFNSED